MRLASRQAQRVADIGAGSGYFTIPAGPARRQCPARSSRWDSAARSRPSSTGGLNPSRQYRATSARAEQRDEGRSPELEPQSSRSDVALMVDVYHELSKPEAMLRRMRAAFPPRAARLVLHRIPQGRSVRGANSPGAQDEREGSASGARRRRIRADVAIGGVAAAAHSGVHATAALSGHLVPRRHRLVGALGGRTSSSSA